MTEALLEAAMRCALGPKQYLWVRAMCTEEGLRDAPQLRPAPEGGYTTPEAESFVNLLTRLRASFVVQCDKGVYRLAGRIQGAT